MVNEEEKTRSSEDSGGGSMEIGAWQTKEAGQVVNSLKQLCLFFVKKEL